VVLGLVGVVERFVDRRFVAVAEPLFFPPPSVLFTVAHARAAAVFRETPRLS